MRRDETSEFIEDAPQHHSKAEFYSSGRCLWLNVIRTAMEEARGVHLILTSRQETQEGIQRAARRWFKDRRRKFKAEDLWEMECSSSCGCVDCVCERAEVDVEDVVKAVRR